jgi:SPP1 gp7 family putative phage head morphogenesis protein
MKPTQNQQLAKEITEKLNEELYSLSDSEINKILKLHKDNRNKILNEFGKIILSYNVKDDTLNLTESEKIKLNKELQGKINDIFKSETKEEIKKVTNILKEITLDKYYSNSYVMSMGLDFTLKKITDKQLDRIIKNTIEGKLYSDRIWDNKNKIAKTIKLEVKKFLNGKTNLNSIEKIIKTKYNSNAFNTKRLVQNETSRVMTGANEKFQKDYGIEHVMWSATLDEKTADYDASLDGKVFRVDDNTRPMPIKDTHIGCRCSYISLPNKDYRPKKTLDNLTKERINYKTYKEWKGKRDL